MPTIYGLPRLPKEKAINYYRRAAANANPSIKNQGLEALKNYLRITSFFDTKKLEEKVREVPELKKEFAAYRNAVKTSLNQISTMSYDNMRNSINTLKTKLEAYDKPVIPTSPAIPTVFTISYAYAHHSKNNALRYASDSKIIAIYDVLGNLVPGSEANFARTFPNANLHKELPRIALPGVYKVESTNISRYINLTIILHTDDTNETIQNKLTTAWNASYDLEGSKTKWIVPYHARANKPLSSLLPRYNSLLEMKLAQSSIDDERLSTRVLPIIRNGDSVRDIINLYYAYYIQKFSTAVRNEAQSSTDELLLTSDKTCVPNAFINSAGFDKLVKKRSRETLTAHTERKKAKWIEIFDRYDAYYTMAEIIEKLMPIYCASVIITDALGNIVYKKIVDNNTRYLICKISLGHMYQDEQCINIRNNLIYRANNEHKIHIALNTDKHKEFKCRCGETNEIYHEHLYHGITCDQSQIPYEIYDISRTESHTTGNLTNKNIICNGQQLNDIIEFLLNNNIIPHVMMKNDPHQDKQVPYYLSCKTLKLTVLNNMDPSISIAMAKFEAANPIYKSIFHHSINIFDDIPHAIVKTLPHQQIQTTIYEYDVSKAHISAMHNYELPVYSALDYIVESDQFIDEPGFYHLHFNEQPTPHVTLSNGWYPTPFCKFLLNFVQITHRFLSSNKVILRDYLDSLASTSTEDELKDFNKCIGVFRKTHSIHRENYSITNDVQEIKYFTDVYHTTPYRINETEFFVVGSREKLRDSHTAVPIYCYAVQTATMYVIDMLRKLADKTILSIKTDAVLFTCQTDNLHRTASIIENFLPEPESVFNRYRLSVKTIENLSQQERNDKSSFSTGITPCINPNPPQFVHDRDFSIPIGKSIILNGVPGSGKTHKINQFIATLAERNIEYLICTPTNCAKSLYTDGITIHKAFGLSIEGNTLKNNILRRYAAVKYIIVDEYSLVSSKCFDYILLLVQTIKCKLIIAGDHRQGSYIKDANARQINIISNRNLLYYIDEIHHLNYSWRLADNQLLTSLTEHFAQQEVNYAEGRPVENFQMELLSKYYRIVPISEQPTAPVSMCILNSTAATHNALVKNNYICIKSSVEHKCIKNVHYKCKKTKNNTYKLKPSDNISYAIKDEISVTKEVLDEYFILGSCMTAWRYQGSTIDTYNVYDFFTPLPTFDPLELLKIKFVMLTRMRDSKKVNLILP